MVRQPLSFQVQSLLYLTYNFTPNPFPETPQVVPMVASTHRPEKFEVAALIQVMLASV